MEILDQFLFQICLWLFSGLLLFAAWSDFRQLIIPNRISIGILALYPAFVLSSPEAIQWQIACLIAGGVFLFGLILFSKGQMGGGDVKLMAVCALWAGPQLALPFVILTAFAGGAISLALLLRLNYGWIVGFPASGNQSRNVPYGVAIAVGGMFVAARLMATAS